MESAVVRITKIYTRNGDAGKTQLGDGADVSKASLRVTAYGEVDEANAALGLAATEAARAGHGMTALLTSIQNELFDVGADLCVPLGKSEKTGDRLRIIDSEVKRLENEIDRHNEPLAALESFVLPGGSELAARLHLARTVVRRAERAVSALLFEEPESTNEVALRYLNRLSDLLFVLARVANDNGAADVLWKPGAQRDQS